MRADVERASIDYLRRAVTEQRLGFTSASQLKDALLLALDRWQQIVPEDEHPCEGGSCNWYAARCGARFCTYEEMAHHNQTCPASKVEDTGD